MDETKLRKAIAELKEDEKIDLSYPPDGAIEIELCGGIYTFEIYDCYGGGHLWHNGNYAINEAEEMVKEILISIA